MNGDVRIQIDSSIILDGHLAAPAEPSGVVIFAHGSGSSRLSPRNRLVARMLREAGMATLLFDLLTPEEDADYGNRFDIDLLGRRLVAATGWLAGRPEGRGAPFGYFGSSTGAAAALIAAAELGAAVAAVVSRGGRPDLAMRHLRRVVSPTLLIVGEHDREVLRLNRQAFDLLASEKRMEIVPGATHLFEEPGTLEQAAGHARDWFLAHFGRREA